MHSSEDVVLPDSRRGSRVTKVPGSPKASTSTRSSREALISPCENASTGSGWISPARYRSRSGPASVRVNPATPNRSALSGSSDAFRASFLRPRLRERPDGPRARDPGCTAPKRLRQHDHLRGVSQPATEANQERPITPLHSPLGPEPVHRERDAG